MPATRLLVLADPKMLQALASGLREGGRFDVLTLPFGDPGAAAAAQRADALALFYGTLDRPLQAALQALAPAVRGRGGRVIAVLQREQAAQRDDCFKAGASDLLFMPMPKEQFVARLAEAVGLSYAAERGAPAAVQVGARGNLVPLAQATVTASGVHGGAALPFQPGETVRLSWGPFETWGLVVRATPDPQIRFAGVTPDEEAGIRDWTRQAMSGAAAKPAVVPAGPAPAAGASARPPATPAASAPRPSTPRPPPVVAPRAAPVVPPAQPARATPTGARAQGGPPPGFAERPRVKDTTPVRPPPGPARAPTAGNGQPPPKAGTVPARASQAAAPAAAQPAAPGLSDLFDDGAPAIPDAAPAVAAPMWPEVPPADACLLAGVALVRDKKAPGDTAPAIAAAAKKIAGVLNVGERGALEKAGTESPFADALAARIALEVGRAEATRLFTSQPPPLVDDASVKAMIQLVDAASARLQKEADGAISRGEVESLQLITASSAALSRDLHSFKETADRLRGVGAAPRLGAGSLDPEVVLPGQAWRPPPKTTEPAPVRAELREFQGMGESSGEGRGARALLVCMLALGGALINVLFFAYPRVHELPPVAGIARIEVSGQTARVTLASDFDDRQDAALGAVVQVLRDRGVRNAVLVRQNGSGAGQLSVTDGKAYGLPPAVKRNDVPLPVVPPQALPQPAPQPDRSPPQPAQTAAGQPRKR